MPTETSLEEIQPIHSSSLSLSAYPSICGSNRLDNSRSTTTHQTALPLHSSKGYHLLEKIGHGGMGVVHRARDLTLNREVAIKILQDSYAGNPVVVERFLKEAQITGQLQHPGIPAIYQVGLWEEGQPFLAMKLIRGQTLGEMIAQQTPINVLAVFEAIAQAVGYAHSCGVIHRDLKPNNIMVGAFGEVQVMDWGLAKWLHQSNENQWRTIPKSTEPENEIAKATDKFSSDLTQAGSVMGTPAYMAPEQARGLDAINERADVFGLGAIFCEVLTQKTPFWGIDAESTRQQAALGNVQDAYSQLDTCGADPDFIQLCKQCLSPNPQERPANAQVVAQIIARLRQDSEARATQADLDRSRILIQFQEQAKRRKILHWASSIVAIVLVLGIVGTTLGLIEAEEARQAEQQRAEAEAHASDLARQRYLAALEAFNSMVFSIQNKLQNRSGTQELRIDLLHNARLGLQKLVQQAEREGNPDHGLVWSHIRMGEIELNLGNTQAAQKEFQMSLELAQSLVNRTPDSSEALRDLAMCFQKQGEIALQLGQTQQALEFYQKSNALHLQLVETDPTNPTAQRLLAVSYGRIGLVKLQLGQTNQALELYQNHQTICQQLVEADPLDVEAQRALSVGWERMGDAMLKLEQPIKALGYFEKKMQIDQQLVAQDPTNISTQQYLSSSYNRLGNIKQQLGHLPEALTLFEKCQQLCKQLVENDPKNCTLQRDLSFSYERLGDVKLKLGRTQEALEYFQKKFQIDQQLVDADPKNKQLCRDLCISNNRLGAVHLHMEQPQKAIEYYQKAKQISQQLAEGDPNNVQAQRDWSVLHWRIAQIHLQQEHFPEAWNEFQKAEQLAIGFSKPDFYPGDLPWIRTQMILCQKAPNVIADIEFLFAQPVEEITGLASIRVKWFMKRNQTAEALATANRLIHWAETQEIGRPKKQFEAAYSLVLCGNREQWDDSLTDQVIELMTKAKTSGFFTPMWIAFVRTDREFAAIRQHPKFVSFLQTLHPGPNPKK